MTVANSKGQLPTTILQDIESFHLSMIFLLVDGPVFQCFFSQMYLERQINMAIKHPLFVDVFRNPAQQVLRKWPDPLYHPASRK